LISFAFVREFPDRIEVNVYNLKIETIGNIKEVSRWNSHHKGFKKISATRFEHAGQVLLANSWI